MAAHLANSIHNRGPLAATVTATQSPDPDTFVVNYLLPDQQPRAARITHTDIEAGMFGTDHDLAEVAYYIVILVLEEPHPASDFDPSPDGTLWLRPEEWIP